MAHSQSTRRRGHSARLTVRRSRRLTLGPVAIPTEVPNTTVIFIFLRKMRSPLLALIGVMAIAVFGLSLMPGDPQPDGSDGRLSVFDAFYIFTYTAATIGFGEYPHEFSIQQRWWVVMFIYLSVAVWAFALGRTISLFQDSSFAAARAAQSFSHTIDRLREPFVIIIGYGYIGRSVARALDLRGRRIVIIDDDTTPIERLATDLLLTEPPALTADARNPAILGIAGLDRPTCSAVLALTGDEEANLQIVMTCRLLRPDIPVIARAATRRIAQSMEDFAASAVVNPYDDYGDRLLLALRKPYAFRLLTWLTAEDGMELPPVPRPVEPRNWLVITDGQFGDQIADDLRTAGRTVRRVAPTDDLDLAGVTAVVAGAESDTTNLALAAHIRTLDPEIYLAVRQQSHAHLPLLEAFSPDSVFFPPHIVTQRVITTLVTPRLWGFLQTIMRGDDEWSKRVTDRIVERVGVRTPHAERLSITEQGAPSVWRWLEHRPVTLGALFRSPQDHTRTIAALPLLLIRDGEITQLPDDDTELRRDDEILMLARNRALTEQNEVIYDDTTLYYVTTGKDIPTSRAWRKLTNQRWKDAF